MILNRFKQLLESTMGNVKPLITENDSDEDISYDIQSVECDGNGMNGHVDIDDDDTIIIRYCEGDDESLNHLKRKGKKLLHSKYGLDHSHI
jgi:hypothetical protein